MDILSKAKECCSKNKKELFFVFLIFLLAFGLRGHLMIYDLLFGFDSYFHARIAQFVVETMTIPTIDPLAYYHLEGGAPMPPTGAFFWFFTAILFKIFTFGAPFAKDTWITAVKFFPALFGALTSVAMYYLGKQMYGKKAGATMAFFAAIVPSFVYRTMAGFFEEDALGFLWMVIGLYFFVKAVQKAEFNKETIKNSIIAAFFFVIMAWTWQMFLLIPIILVAWFFSTLALMWFRKDSNEKIINLAKSFAITFILFSVFTSALIGTGWIDSTTGYVTSYLPVTSNNIDRINTPGGDGTSVYSVSVGEEQSGFKFWGNKYSALIVFPFVALLLLIPYRLLRKKNDYVSFMLFYWILVTMFMAYIRLKFTYTFGLPIAAAAGITIHELFNWTGKRFGFEKKLVALSLGFMFLIGISAGVLFVANNAPSIEQNTGWKESLLWLNENTPEDSKLFNWWDEGHWITFISERAVSNDNRNLVFESNSDMALFMITGDESEAHKIIQKYGADYVVVSEDLVGKMGSLGLYAYNTTNGSDERISKYISVAIGCSVSADELSGNQTVYCGQNALSAEEYMALPVRREEESNKLISNTIKGFVYKSETTPKIFIMNKEANDTMLVKLFFDYENIPFLKLVYSNREVRIFEVVK